MNFRTARIPVYWRSMPKIVNKYPLSYRLRYYVYLFAYPYSIISSLIAAFYFGDLFMAFCYIINPIFIWWWRPYIALYHKLSLDKEYSYDSEEIQD